MPLFSLIFPRCCGVRGERDKSVEILHEALSVDPNSEVAHVSMGVALGSKQNIDGAIAEFREAIHLEPKDDNAHYNLGVALMNKRDADGAIAEYREAIRLNPNRRPLRPGQAPAV